MKEDIPKYWLNWCGRLEKVMIFDCGDGTDGFKGKIARIYIFLLNFIFMCQLLKIFIFVSNFMLFL